MRPGTLTVKENFCPTCVSALPYNASNVDLPSSIWETWDFARIYVEIVASEIKLHFFSKLVPIKSSILQVSYQ